MLKNHPDNLSNDQRPSKDVFLNTELNPNLLPITTQTHRKNMPLPIVLHNSKNVQFPGEMNTIGSTL